MNKISLFKITQELLIICGLILTICVSVDAQDANKHNTLKVKTIRMTSFAFGGTGILFTNINSQFAVMIGERGSATFNNRYTFGGEGWGMPKGVELQTNQKDTFNFFKFGYGGLEFGYIIYPGKRLKFGTNLLVAYGAGFKETVPK